MFCFFIIGQWSVASIFTVFITRINFYVSLYIFFSSAEERDDKFPHHRVFVMLLVSNGWHFFLKTGFNRLAPPIMEKRILLISMAVVFLFPRRDDFKK